MNINKQQLVDETAKLGNCLYDGMSFDRIGREWSSFLAMNSIIANLTGYCLNHEIIFEDKPNTRKFIKMDTDRSLFNFYHKVLSEKDLYLELFRNYVVKYNDSEMMDLLLGGKFRGYSDKDAKDIIFSFFSQYGNKPYEVVKKMFDEERIQMGYQFENSPSFAFHTGSVLLEKGYVCMYPEKFDTTTLSFFAHEMGHVIDKEVFYYPQQKKIKVYDDPFNEIPSSFFDWGMLDYLIKNKIDVAGATTYKAFHMNQIFVRSLYLARMLMSEDLHVDDEDEISEDFRQLFLYGIGYYTSLAMNEMAQENPKEYFKFYTDMICSRGECDYISLIENGGIDAERFIKGEFLQGKIDKEVMALKKRYNYKE